MKLKQYILVMSAVGSMFSLSSCNDFLELKPLDQVTPDEYFATTDHLAAYSISKYNDLFTTHRGNGAGTINADDDTDNMVQGGYNRSYFEPDQWRVPNSGGGWNFALIRYCNYFFQQAFPKFEAGQIQGDAKANNHYVGEMYVVRALAYFEKLKKFGDCPIVEEVLVDDHPTLVEHSKRQPRNLVARYIIDQLDKAIQLLSDDISGNKTRISRHVALLLKSRVALYEATFEKYHKGTGRVPGDPTWPGKAVHPDFNTNIDDEINFFLDKAMEAAQVVADEVPLTQNTGKLNPESPASIVNWNPYFEMFADEDMSQYDEVLFWKDYHRGDGISISHGTPAYVATGGNNGMLKSFVDCFLMEDGLPAYESDLYKGDKTIMDVKSQRDQRLQLFLFGEDDMVPSKSTGDGSFTPFGQPNLITAEAQVNDNTGYRVRKCLTYDYRQIISGQTQSTTGCIIYRAVEAYLNYIEAYYLRHHKIEGKAAAYWKAVRNRAGVNADFQLTIAHTDMAKETDLAIYSGEAVVDATLYNIRRERRCEFIGEGMRWDDLVRWRSWDRLLTHKFIPEGYNFWEEAYKTYDNLPDGSEIIADPSNKNSNLSSRELSNYIRPYGKTRINNPVFDGYSWAKAYYLSPIAINEILLASPDNSIDHSVIYQNPYWPNEINGTAIE